jgi:hypothetical protein
MTTFLLKPFFAVVVYCWQNRAKGKTAFLQDQLYVVKLVAAYG